MLFEPTGREESVVAVAVVVVVVFAVVIDFEIN
jgi:hypothetical protein